MCYDFLQGNHRGLPCETTSEQQIKGREENILKVLWGGQYSNGNGVQSVQVGTNRPSEAQLKVRHVTIFQPIPKIKQNYIAKISIDNMNEVFKNT